MPSKMSHNKKPGLVMAADLLQRHIETLVDDNARWQTLIADDIVWELAYAPALGHPARLSGRAEALRHATWFVGAVQNFRFFDLTIYRLIDPDGAPGPNDMSCASSGRSATRFNALRITQNGHVKRRSACGNAGIPPRRKQPPHERGVRLRRSDIVDSRPDEHSTTAYDHNHRDHHGRDYLSHDILQHDCAARADI